MLLTLTTTTAATGGTGAEATDLGFLLHKHPDRVQRFEVTAGTAHVFYPEATPERCTVALQVEVDPVALVRGRRGGGGESFALGQHVNDRPYAGSSMLAVALGKVFRTALAGRCDARPELVGRSLALEVHVPAVASVGGAELVRDLFAPLGWRVEATPVPLDETVPAWGDSRYVDLRLTGEQVLADALSHLYVLLPVLDGSKHYWVSHDEVDKLLRAAGSWLPTHPARDLVTRRYLARQRDLVATATARLAELDDRPAEEPVVDAPTPARPLVALRREAVLAALREAGAARVVDVGCGEGALLRDLLADTRFTEVVGVDVSARALELAERRLGLERMPDTQRARLRLLQGSVTYLDERLAAYDAIVLSEVVEHLDPDRLPALEASVFGHARPRTVVVTTPNVEHNVRYPRLAAGTMRHPDHRFEWTRAELAAWAARVAGTHGYTVALAGVGGDDAEVGPPTQLALFTRVEPGADQVGVAS